MQYVTEYNRGLQGEPRNFPAWMTRTEREQAEREYLLGRKHGGHKGKGK